MFDDYSGNKFQRFTLVHRELPISALRVATAVDRLKVNRRRDPGQGIYLERERGTELHSFGNVRNRFSGRNICYLSGSKRGSRAKCLRQSGSTTALPSPRMRSPPVRECGEALEELARYKEVELVWVPGQCGTLEKEKAD
ncbi:hypothetical protein NQ317_003583 [Molorchus minor]|uniref:Uncharacterized protein n=1 Tax=Molorchus minor TaxID=1323400 RepID=A0ABQ9IRQ9_9CUCU|nr:hypothetical protein NQ317_003583 [Molorchus minor]